MVLRFPRRRRGRETPPAHARADADSERLDSDNHAWWASRELDAPWAPRRESTTEPEPDVADDPLAAEFGADWRTSILFEPSPVPPVGDAPVPPPEGADPYELLEVAPSASWEEIVAAQRRLVRLHHPDRFAGGSADQRAAADDWIRAINAAYQELKVRRGR